MGKASKWFKGLLGFKKSDPNPNTAEKLPTKKKWSFAKTRKEKDSRKYQHSVAPGVENDNSTSKHNIVVAAATSAVSGVKLTSSGGKASQAARHGGSKSVACVSQSGAGYGSREAWAAVTIQSHFRAYLSRRALRALKALVKLQALVRGHNVRKQTADILRRMQALVRAQARARAGRALNSEASHSSAKSSHFNHTGPATPEKSEHIIRARSVKQEQLMMLKRNGSKSNSNTIYDTEKSQDRRRMGEKSWDQGCFTRIIPMDDQRNVTPKRRNIFYSSHLSHSSDQYYPSFSTSTHQTTALSLSSSAEVQSLSPLKFTQDVAADGAAFCTAENSPQFYSASSMGGSSCSKRAGPFTPPTKNDGSRSWLSGYSDHPNYMAYTESSKAKVRSISAPKQRPQYERSSSMNRYSVHGYGNTGQKVSALHASFTSKAYPGSGRLDRLGMPIRGDISGFSGGPW